MSAEGAEQSCGRTCTLQECLKEKVQPAQPHDAAASSTNRERRMLANAADVGSPATTSRTVCLVPTQCLLPGPVQPMLQKGGSFLGTQGHQLFFTSLLHAGKLVNLVNCILSQGPSSSPKIHMVAAAQPF